jgi:cell division protein FtsB
MADETGPRPGWGDGNGPTGDDGAGHPGIGNDGTGNDATGDGPRTAKVRRRDGDSSALRRPAPDASGGTSRDDTPPFGRRRHGRVAVGAVAVMVVGALVAALFVLPVKAWLGQRAALADSEKQLDTIWAENKRLEGVYDELQTDAVVEEQAREQFGLIKPGELPLSVLPAPPATALPTGWPYDQVQQILLVRSGAPSAATPAAP